MLPSDEPRLIHGDCLQVLKTLETGCARLAYLDPPFLTQKTHSLSPRDRSRSFSFDDSWASSDAYVEFLRDRVVEVYRVLGREGSLFFHCDRNAAHHIRLLLDEVFGTNQFRAEIVWTYRRWSNSKRGLLPAHQTIYYYTKSDDFTFNPLWEEYSPSTNVDQILQQRERDQSGKAVYKRTDSGQVLSNGAKRGVPLSDVWDIPYLNPKARERTGYPTQKPLLLLERIVTVSTNQDDLVLDPFCGSGTTIVAARRLSRRAIGIDVSRDALDVARKRLLSPIRSDSRVMEEGRDSYRTADENALSLLQGIGVVPVHRNGGIDGFLADTVDGKPIPVRVQRSGETIHEAAYKLFRAAQNKDIEVMFLVAMSRSGCLPFEDDLPPGVVIIDSPALGIGDRLRELRSRLQAAQR